MREEKVLRAGKLVGKARTFTSHTEQDILCSFTGQVVTIVVNANGLIVCRSWKKCEHHGKTLKVPGRGVTMCPETHWRELQSKQHEEKKKPEEKINGMTALIMLAMELQKKILREAK